MNPGPASGDDARPSGPARRIGILTTDADLVVRSWDAALASMTGIEPADAIGRPLTAIVPDLESRGLLRIIRETVVTAAPTVLAPAFHKYLIPAPPVTPSPRYDRMQQRVALAALLAAATVSAAGLIGFVGLVVPHLARMLGARRHRPMIVASALVGATLVVGADILALRAQGGAYIKAAARSLGW